MAAGYTMDELRSLYKRNRYKRDVWDRLRDFAPGLTTEELETIVGETRKEQYEGRKKKACQMREDGKNFEEIAAVIDMSVNTVRNLTAKWQKEFGLVNPGQKPETEIPSEEPQAEEVTPTIPPMPETGSKAAQEEQSEERQILYKKIEELERQNESLKGAVTAAEARYNAAAQGQMAALEEVKKLTAANRLAEKEAPSVRSLIREAMELISDGTLGDGERISIETTNVGTTVLIEKLP